MNDHRGRVRLESLCFGDSRSRTVQQLITNLIRIPQRETEPKQVEDKSYSFDFSVGRAHEPLAKSFTERFVDLALDSNCESSVSNTSKEKQIALTFAAGCSR